MESSAFMDALRALTAALDHLVPLFFLLTAVSAIFAARAAAKVARTVKQDLLLGHAPQLTVVITRVTKPIEIDGKGHFQIDVGIGNIGNAQVLVKDVKFRIEKTGFPHMKGSRLETGPKLIPPNGTDRFAIVTPTKTMKEDELDKKMSGASVKVLVVMTDVRGKRYELEAVRKPTINPSLADAARTGEWSIEKHEYRGHVFDVLRSSI